MKKVNIAETMFRAVICLLLASAANVAAFAPLHVSQTNIRPVVRTNPEMSTVRRIFHLTLPILCVFQTQLNDDASAASEIDTARISFFMYVSNASRAFRLLCVVDHFCSPQFHLSSVGSLGQVEVLVLPVVPFHACTTVYALFRNSRE